MSRLTARIGQLRRAVSRCRMRGETEVQAVVANHHPEAVLSLETDIDALPEGMDILVTSTTIYISCLGSAPECRKILSDAGLHFAP